MTERPRVLIEDWLPVVELGIESRREAAPIPGQFPKLKTLHVWWARRPLVASAAAVLGSLMPTWSDQVRAIDPDVSELQSDLAYKAWFLRLCGILGDPISGKRELDRANELGIKLRGNGYGYKPAFKNSPSAHDLDLLHRVLQSTWGVEPSVCDPTAGGGSIPYEAIRYRLNTSANDLNPVAAAILRAGVELPSRFGPSLTPDIKTWGDRLVKRIRERLIPYFQLDDKSERIVAYVFARTVACPRTGKPVPLSPNWWLSTGSPKVAVRLRTHRDGTELERCEFEILRGKDIDFDPSEGTVAGGDGISPWDGLTIDGDYIKAQAQADRMGSQLYAVAIRTPAGRTFRQPTQTDLHAVAAAEAEMARVESDWLTEGLLPAEEVPDGLKTAEPRRYGMNYWYKMFSPRQRLVHGTFVDEFRRLVPEIQGTLAADKSQAVLALLALMQGKGLNYNSRMSVWHPARNTMANTFDRHDYGFKWTHGEFEGARELYPWCLDQIADSYAGIAELLPSDGGLLHESDAPPSRGAITVTTGNAADLDAIPDHSVTLICIDPPYYANVMYAELADYFYVWEKRTLGLVYPELFIEELTDKKNEAVANVARFADAGPRKKQLATADYRAKMTAIFAECGRTLDDRGVLTVMFTHKEADAWDSLGTALMQSGFTIETSWPVNTESEHSSHQALKNAASSTIMLVCRKRLNDSSAHPFFEDLEADVRAAARDATVRFAAAGITGVDLLLSTYGPALSVISANWPVYSSEGDEATGRSRLLRPEEALHAAREEVVRLRRQRLVGSAAVLDSITDFALLAWDTFKAAKFPFDEARRLALAVGGLDVEELVRAKIIVKESGTVVMQPPARRIRKHGDSLPGVRTDAVVFPVALDAVHTVMYVDRKSVV